MIRKNTSGGVYLAAYDTTASPVAGKTGDASNITGAWSKDGGAETAGFTTANPTEIGGGVYWQPLTAAETNGDLLSYRWASSTTGIVIDPIFEPTYSPPGIRKNVALAGFVFQMVLSDHATPATGKTVTCRRSIDGAAFGACTNSASEIVDVTDPGNYKIDLSAADLNGGTITLAFSEATCDTTYVTIVTQP